MIVVDTSVWIAARRRPSVADVLEKLIDADEVALALPVQIELLAGVARQYRKALTRALGALPCLVPTDDTWAPLVSWVATASEAGEHFAFTDLMIAALAADIGGLVWSMDEDFKRMERLKFIATYVPPPDTGSHI